MPQLNLDLLGGQASAAAVKGIVGDMREVIGRIKASSAAGMSDWIGTAAKSFDASHTDWHTTAIRLEQALDVIESKLTTSFRGYDDVDAAAAATFGGSGAQLDV